MTYEVRWTADDGTKRKLTFMFRKHAVTFLNRLILDCGMWDAKLVSVK